MQGVTFDALKEEGWVRLNVPRPYLPYAEGGFTTPSGKCEFYSARMAQMGLDPLPAFTAPYEFPDLVPDVAAKYPLTLISSPRHQFLNSTFVNVASLRWNAQPEVMIHPVDAARRGIWWTKLAGDGENANATTSQRETDLGHGPVFYDNLVEVSAA
jgi:anaerobic selenocysteine-containing dehydrogenase